MSSLKSPERGSVLQAGEGAGASSEGAGAAPEPCGENCTPVLYVPVAIDVITFL